MSKRSNLTHPQFFQVCETIRNHREEIVSTQHNLVELSHYLKGKVGFSVSTGACKVALESVGVELVSDKASRKRGIVETARGNTRVISRELVRLYRKLGEEVHPDLIKVMERANGKNYSEDYLKDNDRQEQTKDEEKSEFTQETLYIAGEVADNGYDEECLTNRALLLVAAKEAGLTSEEVDDAADWSDLAALITRARARTVSINSVTNPKSIQIANQYTPTKNNP